MYKVFLFGIGDGSKNVKANLDLNKCEIVGYIDNNKQIQGQFIQNKKIIGPDSITKYEYDFIIIANSFCNDILSQLLGLGISREKIIIPFLRYFKDDNDDIILYNKLIINKIFYYRCSMELLDRDRRIDHHRFDNDFIRVSSLELIADEIYNKSLKGNIAELGVFRGDFASIMNELFFDRKLYLFDTFEGFDIRDVAIDTNKNYSASSNGDFKSTNTDIVLKKMIYCENCIIKKGYFPDSVDGLEDRFIFVSLDADLYKPTYDGLKYFYPRLNHGGYLFIHDYNNRMYCGVKEAVNKFCNEENITVFPLSDVCGTGIIMK